MADFYKDNKNTINKLLFLSGIVSFLYLFFNVIFNYVAPFVFGFIVSLALYPLVKLITGYLKINRTLATIFSILLLLFLLGLLSNLLFSRIFEEGKGFFDNLPRAIEYVNNTFAEFNKQFTLFYDLVPLELQTAFSEMASNMVTSITSAAGSFVKNTSAMVVAKVPNAFLSFILTIISAFFFTKDRELIYKSVQALIPDFLKNYGHILKESIVSAIIGYIKAQLILMSIVASVCVIGFLILDVPYALFLGFIIAVVDALPVFGSGFFYWPWIAFCLITGNYGLAAGLGMIYLLIFVIRQGLEPKVLGSQIGIHPLITLMSIYIGLRVFGFFGICIGPGIAIVIKAVFEAPAVSEANT